MAPRVSSTFLVSLFAQMKQWDWDMGSSPASPGVSRAAGDSTQCCQQPRCSQVPCCLAVECYHLYEV